MFTVVTLLRVQNGFDLFALMKQVFTMVPEAQAAFDEALKSKPNPKFTEAFAFFAKNTSEVQVVVNGGRVQRLFFPKPIICNFLTKATRDRCVSARGENGRGEAWGC